jgi:hypothetical protein
MRQLVPALACVPIMLSFLLIYTIAGAEQAKPGPVENLASPSGDDVPAVVVEADGGSTKVPRWQPCDFVFVRTIKPANTFMLAFSATVKSPGNVEFKTPGFYDGDGRWTVRVSPNAEGAWSLVTHSAAPELDGRKVAFQCVPNTNRNIHGALGVDPDHRHHFVLEDGTRYFMSGYECDWLWALDLGKAKLDTLNPFLDKLTSFGFNNIIVNAYAHDTTWKAGKTGPDDFGPPPMYAWEGTNANPDHSRMNPAYWRHYDRMIQALHRRGIIAHVMIKVYNKSVKWPAKGSAEDDLYFRWMAARYAAFPNVTWDLSKEWNNEKDADYKTNRIRFLRENDPYRRLVTVHDDRATYDRGDYNKLLDYRSDQQHDKWRATMLEHRRQCDWPVVNVEYGYECGPGGVKDLTYQVGQSAEEVCRRSWEVCMAGGYGAYYYTYTAWDVIRPQDTPPGYAFYKNQRQFFEAARYWLMEPADNLVSDGYCLANPGKEYIVYLNKARPFTLKLDGTADGLKAEWFQPLTGRRQDAGLLKNGTIQLGPPAAWGDAPVALHVGGSLPQ